MNEDRALLIRVQKAGLGLIAAASLVGCGQPAPDEGVASASPELSQDQASQLAPPPNAGGQDTLALASGTPKRTRTIAGMMFDISAGPPDPTRITNLLTGPGQSLQHMYREISYGQQDITVDLFGPYTLPVANCLTIACCGPSSDKTGNGSTVAAEIAALPMKYDHYFWIYGGIPASANCGTWGDEGSANSPAVYSSYSFQSLVGQSQELGHNFGMTHEPTITCSGNVPFADDPSQCTHKEYGNTLSFMGSGAHHPSAYHKFQEGWISGCNVVKAGMSDTFTLVPQELPCDGVQLLQIKAPKNRGQPAAGDRQNNGAETLGFYYLEMRAPYGFDSGLGPMVLVSIGADLPTGAQRGSPYLYVLDLVPGGNLNDAGLKTVGQSYSDPAGGLTITLKAIDSRSATVEVTMTGGSGSHVCADNSAFTAPGPDGASCGPLVGGDGGLPEAGSGATSGARDASTDRGGSTGGVTGSTTGRTTGTGATGGAATTGTGGSTTSTGTATGGGTAGAASTTGATSTTGAATTGSAGVSSTNGAASTGTSTGGIDVSSTNGSGGAAASGSTGTSSGRATSSASSGSPAPAQDDAAGSSGSCSCSTVGRSQNRPSLPSLWLASTLLGIVASRSRRRNTRSRLDP